MSWSRDMSAASLTSAALVMALLSASCEADPEVGLQEQELMPAFHPDTVPMPASMLRRLAAAADGIPDTGERWVVADPTFPHNLAGAYFASRAEAEAYRDGQAPGYEVFGPLARTTPVGPEQDPSIVTIFMVCKTPWTRYTCDDDLVDDFYALAEIDSITIAFYSGGEPRKVKSFRPDSLDAVFFNLRAYDRFAVPYNVGLYGIDHARAMRDSLRAAADSAIAEGG